MKHRLQGCKARVIGLLLGAALAYGGGAALAQDGLALNWWTIDGGGTVGSRSGGYTLNGTIGQPDAHETRASDLTLRGGFWSDASAAPARGLYLPLVSSGP